MGLVTCSSCGAAFELTPELPDTFTCGACGAEVTVLREPAPVTPARPARPVARPAARPGSRPVPRPAARPGRPLSGRASRDAAPAPQKSKAGLWIAVVAGAAVLIAGGWFLFGGGKDPEPQPEKKPAASTNDAKVPAPDKTPEKTPDKKDAAPAETKPVEAASGPQSSTLGQPSKSEPAKTEEETDESGGPELSRFKRMANHARSAKEHFDAAQFGKGQLEAVKKATPASPEIPEFDKRIKSELMKALDADPAFAPAHTELGHVRYSKKETSGWAKSDRVPKKLVTTLEEAIEAIEPERAADQARRKLPEVPDEIWLTGPLSEKYGPALGEGCSLHEDRGSSKTSWFYKKADGLSKRIEGEIGVYLSESRDKDAFDPVIFRPYLLMVQKDPKQNSVDRAYEVVQLFRTLEETWRRRYAKEIDFSGSLSAPPIILLRSREEYAKYQTRHEVVPVVSAGHYEPYDRRMVIYKSDPVEERVVIFHEGTHVLFDHKNSVKDPETQSKQSMWFSEGIAEYFGGHGATGEKDPVTGSPIWEPGRVNDTRIDAMMLARGLKQLIPFDELVKTTRAEWAKRNVKERMWSQMMYAQGWTLVYYLNHGESGKYQKDFVEYMKLELNGKSGADAFKEAFGKYGIDKIQKGYEDFLDYIMRKHKEKKIVDGKIVE